MKQSEPLSESYYYILICLAKGANHGYGIMQMTKELSKGKVTIGAGTMYGASGNMLKKGWIEETFSDMPGTEKRRLYQLTEKGKTVLKTEIERLRNMIAIAEEV